MRRSSSLAMARNGCKKIIIVNGHGGNTGLLPYFAQWGARRPALRTQPGTVAERL